MRQEETTRRSEIALLAVARATGSSTTRIRSNRNSGAKERQMFYVVAERVGLQRKQFAEFIGRDVSTIAAGIRRSIENSRKSGEYSRQLRSAIEAAIEMRDSEATPEPSQEPTPRKHYQSITK